MKRTLSVVLVATLAASTVSVVAQEGMPAAPQSRFSQEAIRHAVSTGTPNAAQPDLTSQPVAASGAETNRSLGVQPAQTSNWSAVQALISGQTIQVTAQGKEVTAEFQSATERQLVITRGGAIVYLDRPDVQQVAYTVHHRYSTKWMWLGVGVGAYWGYKAGQGAGPIAIPIDMALLGGLGAWIDYHGNSHNQQHVVVVYRNAP